MYGVTHEGHAQEVLDKIKNPGGAEQTEEETVAEE
jgi:hypothetical protein